MKKDLRDAFFDEIYKIAKKDKNVVFITDDMDAFSLRKFKADMPGQFINIGVSEQNMIDVAAGLACCGRKVFVYGICNFVTSRCYEQIKFSVCSMNLPVVIIGVGTGFSFPFDGPTHHGTCEIGLIRTLPEIEIYNPSDAASACAIAKITYNSLGPSYVRLDKGIFPNYYSTKDNFNKGFKIIRDLRKTNFLSYGFMTREAVAVAKELSKVSTEVGVVDIFKLKPISSELVREVLQKVESIVTLEEHSISGGLGTIISEIISDCNLKLRLKRISIPDLQIFKYGSRQYLQEISKIDIKSITEKFES